MTSDEAVAHINGSDKITKEIRCTAMVLRTEILKIPPQKTGSSTFIHKLKKNAPKKSFAQYRYTLTH